MTLSCVNTVSHHGRTLPPFAKVIANARRQDSTRRWKKLDLLATMAQVKVVMNSEINSEKWRTVQIIYYIFETTYKNGRTLSVIVLNEVDSVYNLSDMADHFNVSEDTFSRCHTVFGKNDMKWQMMKMVKVIDDRQIFQRKFVLERHLTRIYFEKCTPEMSPHPEFGCNRTIFMVAKNILK